MLIVDCTVLSKHYFMKTKAFVVAEYNLLNLRLHRIELLQCTVSVLCAAEKVGPSLHIQCTLFKAD